MRWNKRIDDERKKEDRWVGKGELKWVKKNLSDEKGQISFFIEFY